MSKRWIIPAERRAEAERLARELRVCELTARMLVNRNLADAQEAQRFLEPSLLELQDPSEQSLLSEAAAFLGDAVRRGRRIALFGDYDADGICATALMLRCLREAGADADFFIPHRLEDGYGLNCGALDALKERGAEVLITLDCGISSHKEARHAAAIGLDLIVTDHHEPSAELPEGRFVLNPHLPQCGFGFEHLAGVGVAFKLAWALGQRMRPGEGGVSGSYKDFLMQALPLVAIGTIADMAPLVGENRVFSHYGLKVLPHAASPGLQALMDVAGVAGKSLGAYHVSFQLAPRLNAVGRLGDARAAVEMLTTDDPRRAADLAGHHERQNRLRRSLQRATYESARQRVDSEINLEQCRCIVLSSPEWHQGVVGLVASKLADNFWRPSFVFSEQDGLARGSARSIAGFPLFEAVRRCEDLLERYGGHKGAAGLSLPTQNLAPFTRRMDGLVQEFFGSEPPVPHLELEGEVELEGLSREVLEELRRLAPFGSGNPEPLFCARELRLVGNPQLVGSGCDHLAFLVRQGDVTRRAIAFGKADWLGEITRRSAAGEQFALAFKPTINTYRGDRTVELRAEDIQWESEGLIERGPADANASL